MEDKGRNLDHNSPWVELSLELGNQAFETYPKTLNPLIMMTFVRGIHRSPVNSLTQSQWCGSLGTAEQGSGIHTKYPCMKIPICEVHFASDHWSKRLSYSDHYIAGDTDTALVYDELKWNSIFASTTMEVKLAHRDFDTVDTSVRYLRKASAYTSSVINFLTSDPCAVGVDTSWEGVGTTWCIPLKAGSFPICGLE